VEHEVPICVYISQTASALQVLQAILYAFIVSSICAIRPTDRILNLITLLVSVEK